MIDLNVIENYMLLLLVNKNSFQFEEKKMLIA